MVFCYSSREVTETQRCAVLISPALEHTLKLLSVMFLDFFFLFQGSFGYLWVYIAVVGHLIYSLIYFMGLGRGHHACMTVPVLFVVP